MKKKLGLLSALTLAVALLTPAVASAEGPYDPHCGCFQLIDGSWACPTIIICQTQV